MVHILYEKFPTKQTRVNNKLEKSLIKKITMTKEKKKTTTKKQTLAQKFEKLEGITNWFERDDFTIEQALPKFEEGLKLASECKHQLEEIENKVTEIKAKFSDIVEEEEHKY